jgi:hypothetical protein
MAAPKPIPQHVVCSECGLAWDKHKSTSLGLASTLEECVRLLKLELATRPQHRGGFTSGPIYGQVSLA